MRPKRAFYLCLKSVHDICNSRPTKINFVINLNWGNQYTCQYLQYVFWILFTTVNLNVSGIFSHSIWDGENDKCISLNNAHDGEKLMGIAVLKIISKLLNFILCCIGYKIVLHAYHHQLLFKPNFRNVRNLHGTFADVLGLVCIRIKLN